MVLADTKSEMPQYPQTEQDHQVMAHKISSDYHEDEWNNWKWHISHTIRDLTTVEKLLGVKFSAEKRRSLEDTILKFPMSITPYYFSLIDRKNYENDPVFIQSVPSAAELNFSCYDKEDPLAEDVDSPAPGITHRYPDRVLFHVSNRCAMYCRHCTRKRKVGDIDKNLSRDELKKGLEYIKNTPRVRDVLLSGGDPLLLPDSILEWLLSELKAIPHVQVIRIGTRVPVVLPQRITPHLVKIIRKYHPVWINTHFNHPREITSTSSRALGMLADAGIPLGNQTVLLAKVNDCPRVMKALVHKLVENRVRPYYLYQCDPAQGLSHFRTSIGKGIEIIENLIGHTSGFAVPTYVIDAPNGGGKIPIMPNYLISQSSSKVILRNYEGIITAYYQPEDYHPPKCGQDCSACNLDLDLNGAAEGALVGIARLLSNYEDTDYLVPTECDRMDRRKSGYDQITTMGTSLIQHGKNSDRIYLMRLAAEEAATLITGMQALATENGYTKLFAKVSEDIKPLFEADGFETEAVIPCFYGGSKAGYFMGKFIDKDRKIEENGELLEDVLKVAHSKAGKVPAVKLPNGYTLRKCTAEDTSAMAEVFSTVFASYPFPIFEPDYISRTMAESITYYGIWHGDRLAALSSAEQYPLEGHVELTDFATLPAYRRRKLAGILLRTMEDEMKQKGFGVSYTSAVAESYGMNISFARQGYKFAGRLKNNTQINGSIKSMNVWYKCLKKKTK
ncbi:lysine 2,3-aminomutase [Dehalococcoides mccartyi]|uniref:lysine 2,3-aminomutase n=1 Tax=Dehalococcoides mccartyi TaxID=61435 RepID=UPI0001BDD147|nr:lysine 2,3-aminomutase [Dehalococcoides mccartyi]AQU05356.1 lysine 2,3-aminomutase [Dehalococcoides mccartyi]AQU06809.1 lysine 2,3-aminomutase [Dehalococcoides mccartyi]AQW61905.1 lysine 2,3-aminomutase [Dehalococcoides mccartyi]AQX72775.1 lysine 2,3-aminomutase [Dehalococcoides mccartyi]